MSWCWFWYLQWIAMAVWQAGHLSLLCWECRDRDRPDRPDRGLLVIGW